MQYLTQPRKEDMFMAQIVKAVTLDPLSDYGKTAPLNKHKRYLCGK